ncbi:structural maintenance of chromosomes protein 6-like isoform X2 [Xyrichtys novacula]|uniref:Structural maintenance of chromosomes protein 6-like isoform X2 n=1 Tax=Xyrichtys novacula TaxID=13765 RepID=A0AAV1GJG2_XYRNO|nr:structural maintenance of chromosomes protein 6-like isoform X2 [Xyrichtys novacula]
MSKRTLKVISDASAAKRRQVAAASIEETPDDTNHEGLSPSSFSLSATGDIGIIESITLMNFMCHRFLGPIQFGPNGNFIVGNNGSGKSAILTDLIIGLGGKANITNRGVSIKDFVSTYIVVNVLKREISVFAIYKE